jgi:hypothetical protein
VNSREQHDLGAEDPQGDRPAVGAPAPEQRLQVLPPRDADGVAHQLAAEADRLTG